MNRILSDSREIEDLCSFSCTLMSNRNIDKFDFMNFRGYEMHEKYQHHIIKKPLTQDI